MARALRSTRGFSLIAVLVILFTLAITLGTMVLLANRVAQFTQTDAATGELNAIYRGIVGDQRDTFGYFGDVSAYPASLVDLVINPGVTGWNGPYVTDPRIANGVILDPWGQPYELYVVANAATSDQLVVISRGPDGLSTNTAANPNVAANFTGVVPTAANYMTDPKNADNRVFPPPTAGHSDALDVNTTSTLAVNIQNFDSNTLVNAFVPACPNLYQVTITSTARGTDDVPATGYAPGFQTQLPQGSFRVVVSSVLLPTPPVSDRFVIYPVVPVVRNYNLTGVDSSGTDLFVLTVVNNSPTQDLDVYEFSTKFGTTANHASTRTYTPHACAKITLYKAGHNDVANLVDTFTMPLGNFTDNEYATAATLSVTNTKSDPINIYNEGVLIGSVGSGKTKTFNVNLFAGNTITVKNQKTGVLLTTFTLAAGANSITV